MSRVAKAPILVPSNVEVTISGQSVTVKGQKGQLKQDFNHRVVITFEKGDSNVIRVNPVANETHSWAQAGTARAIINNMVKGVSDGFLKKLELLGVGYRAQSSGAKINLSLGFSHPIDFDLPEGITCETPTVTSIVLQGIDKQLLGQVASKIRSFRPPEPYKGKGIRYAGEVVQRKEAKKK